MLKKIVILQSVVILVLIYFLFNGSEPEIKVVEKILKETDTIWQSKPQKIKKVFVSIPNKEDKKQTKEFIYKDTLKNGILNASIFADTIYQRNIEMVTFNKETTIEKTKIKPSIYIAPTVGVQGMNNVQNIGLKAYLSGGKLLMGSGVSVDLNTKEVFIPITVGFRF
jgi:hypothetical protein